MRYFYDFAERPIDDELTVQINGAAERLGRKLQPLRPEDLPISELYRRILGETQDKLTIMLQLFTYVLAWSLRGVDEPLEDVTLIEVGGGLGMLSLLAKEAGVGTVVYNDIYDIACADATEIAARLEIPADHYVVGDIEDLINFTEEMRLEIDSVGSYDVIEHVYDIDAYLARLAQLPGPTLSIAMASGANMFKSSYRNWIMPFQRECELVGRESEESALYQRDTLRPYVQVRREMIESVGPGVAEADVRRLVEHTRGMRQDDIEKTTREFVKSNALPPVLEHPTNTCDPYTGNWQEHLMNPDDLVAVLRRAGFDAGWLSGYFSGRSPRLVKRSAARIVNIGMRVFNKRAIRIAPYYMLHGRLTKN